MSLFLRGTHTVCMPAFFAPRRLPIVSSAMIVSKGLIESAGSYNGIVLYGKPVSAEEVADHLQESVDTAKTNLRKLEKLGYVRRKRVFGSGYCYEVIKSKKWLWSRTNRHRGGNPSMAPLRVEEPSVKDLIVSRETSASDRAGNPSRNKENKTSVRHIYIDPGFLIQIQDEKPGESTAVCPPREAWALVLEALRKVIPSRTFDTFLKPTHGIGADGRTLLVSIPNRDFCFIKSKFEKEICGVVTAFGYQEVKLVPRDGGGTSGKGVGDVG